MTLFLFKIHSPRSCAQVSTLCGASSAGRKSNAVRGAFLWSIDWFKGKSTGNHGFLWIFPWNYGGFLKFFPETYQLKWGLTSSIIGCHLRGSDTISRGCFCRSSQHVLQQLSGWDRKAMTLQLEDPKNLLCHDFVLLDFDGLWELGKFASCGDWLRLSFVKPPQDSAIAIETSRNLVLQNLQTVHSVWLRLHIGQQLSRRHHWLVEHQRVWTTRRTPLRRYTGQAIMAQNFLALMVACLIRSKNA